MVNRLLRHDSRCVGECCPRAAVVRSRRPLPLPGRCGAHCYVAQVFGGREVGRRPASAPLSDLSATAPRPRRRNCNLCGSWPKCVAIGAHRLAHASLPGRGLRSAGGWIDRYCSVVATLDRTRDCHPCQSPCVCLQRRHGIHLPSKGFRPAEAGSPCPPSLVRFGRRCSRAATFGNAPRRDHPG